MKWFATVRERTARAVEDQDPEALASLAKDLKSSLIAEAPNLYADLFVEMCRGISNWQLVVRGEGSRTVFALISDAIEAVGTRISPVERAMLAFELANYGLRWPNESETAWGERRKQLAEISLRHVRGVRDVIDPSWDESKGPPVNVVPLPPGVGGFDGMSPEGIKDPVLRKQYEDAIAENHRKRVVWNGQMEARRFNKTQCFVMLRVVRNMYETAPLNSAELETLANAARIPLEEVGVKTEPHKPER